MMKKIKPSELEAEAQRLIEAGQMPSLETLLAAIAEVRKEYREQVLSARQRNRFEIESAGKGD